MSLLPLRDAASAEPVELVFPSASEGVTQVQRLVQPLRSINYSLWPFCSPAVCVDSGRFDYLSSIVAHHQRELFVAELADRGSGLHCIQRFDFGRRIARSRGANDAESDIHKWIALRHCRR